MTPRKGGTVAGLGCALFVALGVAACGGKIAPTAVQDEDDAAAGGGTMDASLADGTSSSVWFACGSGMCPPNTFCQDPSGTSPGACIPFPLECKRTPYTPSETCACLERRASQDRLCRPNRFVCPYPTADLNGVHIGCLPE
jgi:hypothetical protein